MPAESVLPPLVLTARFDAAAGEWLEALRQAHFPPERNWVPAHLTLFHALPGAESSAIQDVLEAECAARAPCAAAFPSWRFTGRGVALDVASPGLAELRRRLAGRWRDGLTAQDRQPWRPHVTIQNKVPPETARALHARLSGTAIPAHATASGLVLWRYRGGPWERLRDFAFEADRTPGPGSQGRS